MGEKIDYKSLYYQLFNSLTDCILELMHTEQGVSVEVIAALEKCQAAAEERYLEMGDEE